MALKTPNDGAAQERAAILRHIKRISRTRWTIGAGPLIEWIEARAVRASKKAGGLGRKKKK